MIARPLSELQAQYAKALVEAWERAERATTRTLMQRFGVGSKTVAEHLHAIKAKGLAHRLPKSGWMPTLLAIETYGTVWVRRPVAPPHLSTATG